MELRARPRGPASGRRSGGGAEAIERFLTLEAAGWKGVAHTATPSTAGEADFFRAVCSSFAADNRLRLLSLEAGASQ